MNTHSNESSRNGPFQARLITMLVLAVFLIFSFFLTYKILTFPDIVIGDNSYFTSNTISDMLSLHILSQQYMGDFTLLSTFINGFLYPVMLFFAQVSLPITLIYPLGFYFAVMVSMYLFSGEFLSNKILRGTVSVLYLVNPVVPYYYTSPLDAFCIVLIPISLKFFVKGLKNVQNRFAFFFNILISSTFFSLTVAAHYQFLLSAFLILFHMILAMCIVVTKKLGMSRSSLKIISLAVIEFAIVFSVVNAPFFSYILYTSGGAGSYYSGSIQTFISNVLYTYGPSNLLTQLRLGGDAGVGLFNVAWYDTNQVSNVLGYVYVAILGLSLLLMRKVRLEIAERVLVLVSALMFIDTIAIITFVKYLPSNVALMKLVFSPLLQTWETPSKLRVVLLISCLTGSFAFFRFLEKQTRPRLKLGSNKGYLAALLIVLVAISYNSPWVVYYAGMTPIQGIADEGQWGPLFQKDYAQLSNVLGMNYSEDRGIIIPYTHRTELYMPPNFRVLQETSPVNDLLNELYALSPNEESKSLGLFSLKYVVVNSALDQSDTVLFPYPLIDTNPTDIQDSLLNDNAFKQVGTIGNFSLLENENALPIAYATRYFVLYSDPVSLSYALQTVDFQKLPAFIQVSGSSDEFKVPNFIPQDNYYIYAVSTGGENPESIKCILTSGNESIPINLEREENGTNGVQIYSTLGSLASGDSIQIPDNNTIIANTRIPSIIANASLISIANSTNFDLNSDFNLEFSARVLVPGDYSYLSPRIYLSCGNNTYVVIFNTDGNVELAIENSTAWRSDVMSNYLGFNLYNSNNSISVSMKKESDIITIYVNGTQAFSFPVQGNIESIALASAQSESEFADVELAEYQIFKLFCVREDENQPFYTLLHQDANSVAIRISTNCSDSAIVLQYQDIYPWNMHSDEASNESIQWFPANCIFNGWMIQGNQSIGEVTYSGEVKNSLVITSLLLCSIGITYSLVAVALLGSERIRKMAKWIRRKS